MNYKKVIISILVLLMLGFLSFLYISEKAFAPTASEIPVVGRDDANIPGSSALPQVFSDDFDIPWGIGFLPGGTILVTERTGSLKVLDENGTLLKTLPVPGVKQGPESGLLGLAIDPDFENNSYVYMYETYTGPNNETFNRIARYLYNGTLAEKTILLEGIPGAQYHDGGRIAFGPDGKLYVTTGDAVKPEIAQDLTSLGGKILRLNSDGSVPSDNPYADSYVYSYGHRNPQGLAWDNQGRLWSSEHGPSGFQSGHDEINLIIPGANYGWPFFAGETQQVSRALDREEYQFPIYESGSDETWAPAGLTIIEDNIYFSGLRGQSIYRGSIYGPEVDTLVRQYVEEFGRIRTTFQDPGGNLGFTTSNTDGRGDPQDGDDKIYIVR